MKHTYIISINRIPSNRESMEYKFRQTKCALSCSRGSAAVRFEMGTKKTHEDLISFRVDLVKDAMRKMHLLHALRYNARLWVQSITISIDGESVVYEENYPGFPFLYSMLGTAKLDLPATWQERDFLSKVISATKTKTDNDRRYACLFSFLAGSGKAYESEKFTCYWTAVNALYNHIFDCAKPYYAADNGAARFEDLSKKLQDKAPSGDNVGVGVLMRLTGSGLRLDSKEKRKANKSRYGAIKSYLQPLPREELPELYRQLLLHRSDPDWFPQTPLGEHLREFLPGTGASCWGFLVLDYAYYIRCHYLHGEKTTILFTAATDPELAAFRALNIFLGEFLKEMIPRIFRDDWFTAQMYHTTFPTGK